MGCEAYLKRLPGGVGFVIWGQPGTAKTPGAAADRLEGGPQLVMPDDGNASSTSSSCAPAPRLWLTRGTALSARRSFDDADAQDVTAEIRAILGGRVDSPPV